MRSLVLLFMLALPLAGTVLAEPEPRDRFRQIITAQLGALQNGDAEGAWQYAHPSIQAQFGNPQRFYRMVELGYRPLIDFTVVRFQEPEQQDGIWIQPITLRNDADEAYVAFYAMQRNDGGQWRIAGVQMLEHEDAGI